MEGWRRQGHGIGHPAAQGQQGDEQGEQQAAHPEMIRPAAGSSGRHGNALRPGRLPVWWAICRFSFEIKHLQPPFRAAHGLCTRLSPPGRDKPGTRRSSPGRGREAHGRGTRAAVWGGVQEVSN